MIIKRLAKAALREIGLQIAGAPKQKAKQQSAQKAVSVTEEELLGSLAEDPLNGRLHLQLAEHALKAGQLYLAYAELKTAKTLGVDRATTEDRLHVVRRSLPSHTSMNHNQYFRFVSLASEIVNRAETSGASILDVGGGSGELASFLPDFSYCLAEPTVNGISGTDLPFPDQMFDYVVSCHVLEHIPVEERAVFLDQLRRKAKRGMLLLNPFHVDGTYAEDRFKLFIELTGAQWAKEHLDCTLPKVEDIEKYARERDLEICIKPNGTLTTSMAFVFVDFFAARSGLHHEWTELNRFFNEKYVPILDSKEYPNAYLVYLGWPAGGRR